MGLVAVSLPLLSGFSVDAWEDAWASQSRV